MLTEITSLYNLEVYTPKGLYLGRVYEIMIDTKSKVIYDLILEETNPNLVDESRSIGVPYRWVQTVSEIIVLRYFPGKVHLKPKLGRYRHKRRKLRVIKRTKMEHGITRVPWDPGRQRRQKNV